MANKRVFHWHLHLQKIATAIMKIREWTTIQLSSTLGCYIDYRFLLFKHTFNALEFALKANGHKATSHLAEWTLNGQTLGPANV